jgi:hypothetical protein
MPSGFTTEQKLEDKNNEDQETQLLDFFHWQIINTYFFTALLLSAYNNANQDRANGL